METYRTSVARLMTSGVLTVTPDTVITDAADTMLKEGVGSLVVVDADDQPVGMLTNTDLLEVVSRSTVPAETTVEQCMTPQVVTIGVQNSIRDAAAKMILNGIHHLPITDDEGGIIGMLSTLDLTAYFSYTAGTDME